jgi:RNA polymerase sigma factor (sigma-70 family)
MDRQGPQSSPLLKGETVGSSRGSAEDLGVDINRLAREWALCTDKELKNELFVLVADTAQQKLTHIARVMASRVVGPDEAADIVNDVWIKVQVNEKFDPDVGSFHPFFLNLVRNRCIDVVRKRREIPAPDDILETPFQDPDPDREYAVALDHIADLEARISAAIDALDLPPRDAEMLRMLIDPGSDPAGGPRGRGAMSTVERQQLRRLRGRIDGWAGLTPDEQEAASLLRKHHTVTAAVAASGISLPELQRRLASAKRRIRTLFNLPSED